MSSLHQTYEEFIAPHRFETPTSQLRLMEAICERNNMKRAIKRVIKNKGAPGVDGMTVRHIKRYLKRCWTKIEKALLDGTYTPMPVRRKEIAKPGGVRLLGIPTVLDRVIQQAVAQIFNRIWDHTFSEFSFGFRPKRSAHDAKKSFYRIQGLSPTAQANGGVVRPPQESPRQRIPAAVQRVLPIQEYGE